MKSNAKQEEVKEEGSLATVVVKGGTYCTSVASRKPPAISARKEGTLQRCVTLLETQPGSAKWVETQAPKQEDNDETALICQVGSHTSPPYEVVVAFKWEASDYGD